MKKFVLVATLLTNTALFESGCRQNEELPPKPVVAVKVAPAETADLELTIQAPATIFPREQANISARVTAPIVNLKARKGDSVSVGQVLAVLENRDAAAQEAEATANVADAEATLQKVSAGTLPADIERAQGQVRIAEAALNQAQKNYDRRKNLYAQGAIPNRDLLASETDLAQAKTACDVARRELELLERQSSQKDIQIARSRVEQAKAREAYAAVQVQFTELKSPLNGTITEQFMYPGDMAKPDAPVFTVMALSVAVARAQVTEADAPHLSRGEACSFTETDRPGTSQKGTITVVNQAVDPARRTVETWCEIPNAAHALRAGLFGSLTVSIGTAAHAVVVPESAVQFKEGTNKGTVFVLDQQRIAHVREVEAKLVGNGKAQVMNGLSAGESVIVEGGYGLPDGTQVTTGEKK